jgi:hypothetical protein
MVIKMFFNMVEKTRQNYLISFTSYITCACSFDLWMSCVGFHTFVIVVSFINVSWEPCHVTIGIFEIHNTTNATIANQVKSLLNSFNLLDKVITYVKDEKANLNTMTSTLIFVVSYSALQLTCPFIGLCFGHAMSKQFNMLLMTINVVLDFRKLI